MELTATGLYYGNVLNAQDYPFLSQLLYSNTSNATSYATYNTTAILTSNNRINADAIADQGLPSLTVTYVSYLITSNMGFTALIVHQLLFNYDDVKQGWLWMNMDNLRRVFSKDFWRFWDNAEALKQDAERRMADPRMDPHYKLMLHKGYKEAPQWWYAAVFVLSFVVGLACLYEMDSGFEWWAFIVSLIILTIMMLFFAGLMGTSGFQFNVQPVVQLLGGYICPNRPLANMYFTCYTYQALQQGEVLLRDLKLGQYVHLAPRCTFMVQMIGCVVGAMFNFLIMITTVRAQAPALRSIEGTNIWSGQNIQQLNTLAVAFSISKDLFNVGKRYEWVTISMLLGLIVPVPFYILHRWTGRRFFLYWNMSIILWYAGYLFVGINSA